MVTSRLRRQHNTLRAHRNVDTYFSPAGFPISFSVYIGGSDGPVRSALIIDFGDDGESSSLHDSRSSPENCTESALLGFMTRRISSRNASCMWSELRSTLNSRRTPRSANSWPTLESRISHQDASEFSVVLGAPWRRPKSRHAHGSRRAKSLADVME